MKLHLSRRPGGFTLIEIIVVVAILAVLMAISAPMLASRLKTGELEACRANMEQISKLGIQYGNDLGHSHVLPTSGMDDDEDTKNIDESEGWWLSIAQEMDIYVEPADKRSKMKISTIFHCPSDSRAYKQEEVPAGAKGKKGKKSKSASSSSSSSSNGLMIADASTVSYVSWTDGSEDSDNPDSCIRTTAKQNLDELPWLSDGVPVKGESVKNLSDYRKMVKPAIERHVNTIIVAYASGTVKAVKVDPEDDDAVSFKRIAPELARHGAKGEKTRKKKSK